MRFREKTLLKFFPPCIFAHRNAGKHHLSPNDTRDMIFYFTGTGNSAYVASHLATQTQERLISIFDVWQSRQWHYTLQPEECLGFVFPVYAWGPPALFMECVRKLLITGNTHPYCYMVCTCGDDCGCTCSLFSKALSEKGWKLAGGFSVTMPNTYVCLPGFDIDDAHTTRQKLETLPQRLADIVRALREKEHRLDVYEGKFPRLKSYVLRPLFNRFLVSDRPFHTNSDCNGCSLCERVCPMRNIQVTNETPRWNGQCTGCLRCYHKCPRHAIEFGTQTRRKGQYSAPMAATPRMSGCLQACLQYGTDDKPPVRKEDGTPM